MNLLKALVLYVTIVNKKEGSPVTMAEVYRLLSTQKVSDLENMFRRLEPTHPAYVPYSIYAQAGDNVRGNVVIGLASRIQVFQSQVTKNITSYPDIDLTLPGKEKCAYFCAISDQDATFTFLSSLFFAFLFIKLVKFADNYGKIPGKLDVPVNFILDEFSNIGQIPDFEKKISTVRSRDINISVIIQNIPQLKSRYPNDVWQEIIGNCDTQLFLGCTDETTAKYISDRSGVATIDIQSEQTVRKTLAVAHYSPDYKQTASVGKRNVMTPDEVLRLPGRQALVIIRGEKLLKVDKFDFTRHPWAKKLKGCRMSARIPRWHRREIEAEAAGYELRSVNGILYYYNPDTGQFYERTAFINANPGDVIPTSVPKGKAAVVDVEKTAGYQILYDDQGNKVLNDAGVPMIVNVQTGETFPFYGFNSRGEWLEAPQTSIEEADEKIVVPEVVIPDTAVNDSASEQNTAKSSSRLSSAFDALIDKKRRRRGSAVLEQEMLAPSSGKRKPAVEEPVSEEPVVIVNPEYSEPEYPEYKDSDDDFLDGMSGIEDDEMYSDEYTEPSFTSSPQSMGSSGDGGKVFDEPEDLDVDSSNVWEGLERSMGIKRDAEQPKPKPAPTPVCPPPHKSPSGTNITGDRGETKHSSSEEKPAPPEKKAASQQAQQQQKKPKQASAAHTGQMPKQNADLFALPTKDKKKKPSKPPVEEDEKPVLDMPTTRDKETTPAPPPPTVPEAYVPQDEPAKASDIVSVPTADKTQEACELQDTPEEPMSAAEIMGELHMAKSSSRRNGYRDTHDTSSRSDPSPSVSTDIYEDATDWDYAFVDGSDVFS